MNATHIHAASVRRVHKRFTRAEEVKLAKAARRGDMQARERLIESQLPYVIHLARRFSHRTSIPLDDLIQLGNQGLILAVDKFDPSRGCRLTTYASWWIKQMIRRQIDLGDRLVHIPLHPSSSRREQAAFIRRALERSVSLYGEAGEYLRPIDCQPVETRLYSDEDHAKVRALFQQLPARWVEVLCLLDTGLDMREVGAELGLSHQRIQQIRASAIKRLRELLGVA